VVTQAFRDHEDRDQIRDAADLVGVIEGYGVQLRRAGPELVGLCPLHNEKTPSFSLNPSKQLFHCHGCGAGGDAIAFVMAIEHVSFQDALKLLADSYGLDVPVKNVAPSAQRHVTERRQEPDQHATEQRRIVATYDYVDERGELLYQVVRFDPKGFAQRRPDGQGGWIWKKGERQVLYHLPEVLEAPIVFVVEGEKDVETMHEYGFVATTPAGGANAPWLPEFTETLRGREVILVPDNDQPGWNRAAVIARALVGDVSRLRIFDLPAGVKDISDWFAAGHSECEFIALLEGADAV